MAAQTVEYYCPDPECGWKHVEDWVPSLDETVWRGSIQETVEATTRAFHEKREAALEAHIRERHDADDPHGWAERTAAAQTAGEG